MAPFRDNTRFVAAWGGLLTLLTLAAGCQSPNHRPVEAGRMAVADNPEAEFAAGVVPTVAPPLRVGTAIAFRLSSSADGYGHLYLVSASGEVTRLAENVPLAAGTQKEFPRPGEGIQILASPPAGIDLLILLVTRQRFAGFADNQGQSATIPMALASTAEAFVREFNDATGRLPASGWAVAEARVHVIE